VFPLKLKIFLLIFIIFIFVSLCLMFFVNKEGFEEGALSLKPVDYVKIIVVIDNNEGFRGLETAWGVAMYVETENTAFLFDTGPDPTTLEINIEKLSLDIDKIDFVFISHEHGDHAGGLAYVSRVKPGIKIYIPKHSSNYIKSRIRKNFSLVEVDKPEIIVDGLISSGELYGGLYEQSLAVYVKDKGLVILTGCSHPGIENIVKHFHELTNLPIYAVIGGFHLCGASHERLKKIADTFKELNVKMVFPIHCSGDSARSFFAKELGEVYKDGHVGLELYISKDAVTIEG